MRRRSSRTARPTPPGFPAASPGGYNSKRGFVYDTEPRTISNLIVDQTVNNPAAVQAAGHPVRSQGNEGVFSCVGIGERQVISGTPSGPFTITFDGQTTGTLAPNANAATVQAALEALSNIGPGEVTVTGSLASNLVLQFSASLGDARADQPRSAAAITGLSLVTDTEGALGSPAVAGTSEVVTISGVSVDPFILSFGGNPTGSILAGASALDVEAALNAAPVNAGVTVADGTSPETYVITFTAHGNVGAITTDSPEQTISAVDGTADVAAVPNTSEVQTLSGTASANFALDQGGPMTGSIAPNASAPAVQSALNAITTVTAAGGPLPTGVTITFDGALGNVPALSANSVPLTGATPFTTRNGVVSNSPGCVAPRRDALHPEHHDGRRPLAAVQLPVHHLRPVLRPRRRLHQQGQVRHRLRAAEGRRSAAAERP